MIDESFFQITRLLNDKYSRESLFNIFKVLRSPSDEVRLHSRFLAHLLDPSQSHGLKQEPLKRFLIELGITDFTLEGISIKSEYKNIDIIICNNKQQAIVIENKIYAADQPQQLYRYYETMRREGKTTIYLAYLTLDGREASDDSVKGIPESFINSHHYLCISYAQHIARWIDRCLAVAVCSAGLRESLIQYKDLIEGLTGMSQSEEHINELKTLLNKEGNISYFQDLQRAYTECLIDYQFDIWNKLVAIISAEYSDMGVLHKGSFWGEDSRRYVDNFYKAAKNKRWYGLYFALPLEGAQVGIEMENQIFYGVRCFNKRHPEEHQQLRSLLSDESQAKNTEWWPMCRYSDTGINYESPSPDMLEQLSNEDERLKIASRLAEELYGMWCLVSKKLQDSK